MLKLAYTLKGKLSRLLGECSSSQEVLKYKDLLITAARAFDPLIIGVQPTENWTKLKVHGVSLNRYLGNLELAKEEIEIQSQARLPLLPRWLKSPSVLLEGGNQKSTLVVTIRDRQLVEKALQAGLYFGGNQYITEKYWESGRGQICPRCCKFGHFEGCTDMVKCYLCGGHHLAKDHLCPVNNCGKRTPCSHLPLKCTNCLGKHYTTSVKCPKKWEDIRLAKEKPKTF